MNGIDWTSGDVVLAGQLVSATALAVYLLILRPRAARHDLLLDARIVEDELDLAERLGHISATNVEIVALHQLLRRIRQNPRSVGLVLERIPSLGQAARHRTRTTDGEYLGGALDRLSDAGQRYLRGAWPRAGALSAVITAAPQVPYLPEDTFDEEFDDPDLRLDSNPGLDTDLALDRDLGPDPDRDLSPDLDRDLSPDPDRDLSPDPDPDPDLDPGLDRDFDGPDHDVDSELDGNETFVGGVSDPRCVPTWVDLVRAGTPRRTSGFGPADRHARPYRPARSSGHSSTRTTDPVDRSSVLPR